MNLLVITWKNLVPVKPSWPLYYENYLYRCSSRSSTLLTADEAFPDAISSFPFEFQKSSNNLVPQTAYLHLNRKLNNIWGFFFLQKWGSHSFNFTKGTLLCINVQKGTVQLRLEMPCACWLDLFCWRKKGVLLLFVFVLYKTLKDGNYKGKDQYFLTTRPILQSW